MSAAQIQRFFSGHSAKYEPLPRKETLPPDDSDDAESSSSMFEDEQFLRAKENTSESHQRRAEMYRQLRSHRRQLLVSMTFHLITLVAIVVFLFSGRLHQNEENSGNYITSGSEIDENSSRPALKEAPDFGYKLVTFEEDSAFMGNSAEVDANWQKLWPVGKGFVQAHGRDNDAENYYVVSAFHQFHCIDVIRTFYNLVASNTPITDFKHIHVPHCVEYLRQSVMCNADPTLEHTMAVSKEDDPLAGQEGHVHQFVDGQYVTHQCRNYGALLAWTTEHRYKNSSRILHDVDM